MDINTLRGIATVSAILGFAAVCYWAFTKRNQKAFDEASMLPFADEDTPENSKTEEHKNNE